MTNLIEEYRLAFFIFGMLIEGLIIVFIFALIEPHLRKYLLKKI